MCRRLGISHAIAFTDDTVRQLETAGFRARADVDLADVPALLKATGAMPVRLTLLEAAEPTTVVGPLSDPALLSWRGSTLTWPARAGTEYQVRYRHYPAFGATQEGRPLSVEVYRPFPELTLEFMRVRARADGPITLRYRGGRA